MITLRDRRTGDLFDRWSEMGEKRRLLLDHSWAGVFRDHLLDDLPIDELLPHFDDRMGLTVHSTSLLLLLAPSHVWMLPMGSSRRRLLEEPRGGRSALADPSVSSYRCL